MYKVHENQIIGAVRLNSEWRFYSGATGEWIMDYKSYDPSYDPEKWPNTFRNGILEVDVHNASEFCTAMKEYELTLDDVVETMREDKDLSLSILMDFDRKLYVNGYYDMLLEEYVPMGWVGISDDPTKFLSEDIKIKLVGKR